jgi:2'-5' RNA ligase superfamily
MALALELGLAADGEREVREMWDALEVVSVPSLATHPFPIRPHVTLSVTDDATGLRGAARALRGLIAPASVKLAGPAFFQADPPIMHLAVAPAPQLIAMHGRVADALQQAGVEVWPHYRPTVWLPHCTLSMGVPVLRLGDALSVSLRAALPIATTLADPRLTDSETGETVPL